MQDNKMQDRNSFFTPLPKEVASNNVQLPCELSAPKFAKESHNDNDTSFSVFIDDILCLGSDNEEFICDENTLMGDLIITYVTRMKYTLCTPSHPAEWFLMIWLTCEDDGINPDDNISELDLRAIDLFKNKKIGVVFSNMGDQMNIDKIPERWKTKAELAMKKMEADGQEPKTLTLHLVEDEQSYSPK